MDVGRGYELSNGYEPGDEYVVGSEYDVVWTPLRVFEAIIDSVGGCWRLGMTPMLGFR